MADLHHNISGELTQELLAAGDNVVVNNISLTNVHASTTCTVDLYIENKLQAGYPTGQNDLTAGQFYLAKAIALPVGATLILDNVSFANRAAQFGLFIKLTKGASETPVVDVIIY